MGTPLGPKYIPYTYMDPLGYTVAYETSSYSTLKPGPSCSDMIVIRSSCNSWGGQEYLILSDNSLHSPYISSACSI